MNDEHKGGYWYTDCGGGGLCSSLGGSCDACAENRPQSIADKDAEINAAGFYGYDGCPQMLPAAEGSCPTPYLCSEAGDCPFLEQNNQSSASGSGVSS